VNGYAAQAQPQLANSDGAAEEAIAAATK